jgi:glycopeptide antibiotics resistance protein
MIKELSKEMTIKGKKGKSIWIVIGCSIALAVIYFSTTFYYPFKRSIIHTPFGDALVHCLSYGLIMLCFCLSWETRKTQIILGSGLFALGIGLEFFQIVMGNGKIKIEFDDILANTLGITLGYLIARLKK